MPDRPEHEAHQPRSPRGPHDAAPSEGPPGTPPANAPGEQPAPPPTEPAPTEPTAAGTAEDNGPQRPRGPIARFLAFVEFMGNLLPHPVSLFAVLIVLLVVLSSILGPGGLAVSVEDPRPAGATGVAEDGQIRVVSMLSSESVVWIFRNLVDNFTGFAPLGTVLVALLGVGVADKSGLLSAAVRGIVFLSPPKLITTVVVFAGVLSNTASEMGYVVLIPLAAGLFHAMGRHPIAGLAAAFAGVSGGYSANLLIGTIDPLLAGITQENARFLAEGYEVFPTANWFFMIVSTFFITAVGSFVTTRIVEPRLGKYDASRADDTLDDNPQLQRLTTREKKGLIAAGIAAGVFVLMLVYLAGPWKDTINLPLYGVLRDDPEGDILKSAFMRSIVAFIFIGFVLPGIAFGAVTGTIKNDRDVIDAMASAMSTMGLYLVLVFFAAQFVAIFGYTNLGLILAVVGSEFLQQANLDGPIIFLFFILMCCVVNLALGSASAQWAVTAPIFVPMLMGVGYSPEVIQAAYRIGDSTTNIVTPMMSYFGLIYAFAAKYDRKLGIGTLISTMIPYSIAFLLGWIILFYVWVFALGLPVGPGSPTTFDLETYVPPIAAEVAP